MRRTVPGSLVASRRFISLLIGLNLALGFGITVLLIGSLIARDWVMRALGVQVSTTSATTFVGMRLIMVLGISAVPFSHVVLTRLRTIVDTVTTGDPFVHENAARLQTIARAVLGLELTHLLVGAVAATAFSAGQPIDIGWRFSLTRWLAVLMLFVLARVFEQGARMREDLAGTV
jgi:hypothetical protein